jgi:hypothetical protein
MNGSRGTAEADWKVFRELQPLALERFCERVLGEVQRLSQDAGKTQHERYLAVYRFIRDSDKDLAFAFNDMRRSTAVRHIACIRNLKLWSEDEFARFSAETRDVVKMLLSDEPL